MTLQVPIPVTFSLKMQTEKAFILQSIAIDETVVVQEAVIPKMYVTMDSQSSGQIESWVIAQRIQEEKQKNVEQAKQELLAMLSA